MKLARLSTGPRPLYAVRDYHGNPVEVDRLDVAVTVDTLTAGGDTPILRHWQRILASIDTLEPPNRD